MLQKAGSAFAFLVAPLCCILMPQAGWCHDPASTARPLLNLETADLPPGRVRINGIERTHPPGVRTPWHTSGPKILHVMDGTLTAYGLGGEKLLTCGPAPTMCFLSPKGRHWYFRNHGPGAVRFVLVGIDSVDLPTIHEEVGQVVSIEGRKYTLSVGDVRTSSLAGPPNTLTIEVAEETAVKIGDDVVTVRHDKKSGTARKLLRLGERWQ